MSKFNVGDRVKVKETSAMEECRGLIGVVKNVDDNEDIRVNFIGEETIGFFEQNLEYISRPIPSFVWLSPSDHELKAEEIEGRSVIAESENNQYIWEERYLSDSGILKGINKSDRYMLIDPAPEQEELKAFDGVMPLTDKYDDSKTYFVVWSKDELSITVRGATEAEARHNWNVWVEEHS